MHRPLDSERPLKTSSCPLTAALIWTSKLHRLFELQLSEHRQAGRLAPKVLTLAERHLKLWRDLSRARARATQEENEPNHVKLV